ALRITKSGNVGIGTTSPGNKFEVRGGTGTTDISTDGILLSHTNTSYSTRGRIASNLDALFLTQNAYYTGSAWAADNASRSVSSVQLVTGIADSYITFWTANSNNAGIGT